MTQKELIDTLEIAKQAIEKQIPKKLNHKTTRYFIQGFELRNDCIYCPLCNKSFDRISDYCPDCGQALDLEFYRFRARSTIISEKENKHERDTF